MQTDSITAETPSPSGPGVVRTAFDVFTRDEVREYSHRSDWRGAGLLAHCWGSILLIWVVCVAIPHPLIWLVSVVLIGTRQLGLGVIGHDAAHYLLFNNRKANDWAAQWFCNRPLLGASIVPYRIYHLRHHQFTQQTEDPDLVLSAPFPASRASLRRKLIRDLTGRTGFKQHTAAVRGFFAAKEAAAGIDWGKGLRRIGPNVAINAVFLAGFALAGAWYLYFFLWVVPYFTWELLVSRIRNIGEHAVVPDNNDRLRNTRTTLIGPLARAFLAPYFVNFHLEHHLLVSAPCYRLSGMHRALLQKGLAARMEIQPGYDAVLRLAASG